MDNKTGSPDAGNPEVPPQMFSPVEAGDAQDKEIATKEDLPSIESAEPTPKQTEPTLRMDAPKWDTVKEVSASDLIAKIPDTLREQLSGATPDAPRIQPHEGGALSDIAPDFSPGLTGSPGLSGSTSEKPEEKKEPQKATRPQRPARVENALTATVLVIAASVSAWMFARPTTLLFPPTQEQAAQLGQSPDCRRVRFDVSQLLGERWRQTIASCLRGGCEPLREALLARNFPVSTWQLLEEDDEQGCVINVQGAAKSPECTRLAGRIEGVAKAVLLQVEGECREKP